MKYTEIKSLLGTITDPVARLEFVMDLGRDVPPIPEKALGREIQGCASRAEIYRDENGNLYGNADAAISRGIMAILFAMAKNKLSITEMRDEFDSLHLNLGTGRMNGAAGMIEEIVNSQQ